MVSAVKIFRNETNMDMFAWAGEQFSQLKNEEAVAGMVDAEWCAALTRAEEYWRDRSASPARPQRQNQRWRKKPYER